MRAWVQIMVSAAVAVTLAGCDDGDDFPAGGPPGNGGIGGGSGGIDAGSSRGDGGVVAIVGRVCVVADVRLPDSCAPELRAGLIVHIGRSQSDELEQVLTDAQGRFVLKPRPQLDKVLVTVEDPTSQLHLGGMLVPLDDEGAADVLVPTIDETTWNGIQAMSQVIANAGNGMVALHAVLGESSMQGAIVGGLRSTLPLYDPLDDPFNFTPDGPTTARGFAIWIDVPPATSATYTVKKGTVTSNHSTTVLADGFVFTTAAR